MKIYENQKSRKISNESNENHENVTIPRENHATHENHWILYENYENQKKLRITCEYHNQNHDIHKIP